MTSTAPDIFLSYGRQDEAVAERMAVMLQAAGFDVWWDRTLRSGDTYDEVIEAALRAARVVLVLWSPRSVGSRWVRSEATVAERAGRLIPVMLETCDRPVSFELVQTTDMTAWDGSEAAPAWQALLAEIRHRMGKPAAAAPSHAPMTAVELATSAEMRLPEKPSVAVLPLAEIGAGPDDHFAEGLAEEIMTSLSQFRSLFVVAAHQGNHGRGQAHLSNKDLSRNLGVQYLLEGSVRRSGDRVRIAMRLTDAGQARQVWAERYDEGIDDVFDLQERVATDVAGIIDSTLAEIEMDRAVARPAADASAYVLTLQAAAKWRSYAREHAHEGVRLATLAMELDPCYAKAVAIAAGCHGAIFMNRWSDDPAKHRAEAVRLAEQALKLDAGNEEVLVASAYALVNTDTDIHQAARLLDHALAMAPGRAGTLHLAGALDAHLGEPARGLDRLERALRMKPRSPERPFMLWAIGHCLFALDRHDEAVIVLREGLRLRGDYPLAQGLLTGSLALLGRMDEARDALARLEAMGGKPAAMFLLGDRAQRKALHVALGKLEGCSSAAA